jgi:hypothetical protein
MNSDFITVSNLKNADTVCAAFDSSMIDVAYATKIENGIVKIEIEPDLDLHNLETYSWLKELTKTILDQHQETTAIMTLHFN